MFTRRAVFRLRADSSAEFTRIVEGDVLPMLRVQEGCRHEDTFISPQLSEAVLNSYWDTQAPAEAYGRAGYLDSLKSLAGMLDGEPRVESFHVSSATYHTLTAARREAHRNSRFGRS